MNIQDIAALNEMIFFIFVMGLIGGAVCTGIFKTIRSFVDLNYKYPKRIRVKDGYLYRFKNYYVSLEERNILINQRIETFKQKLNPYEKRQLKVMIFMTLFTMVVFILFIQSGSFQTLIK